MDEVTKEKWIKYTQYIILPSLKLWKLSSIISTDRINTLLNTETLLCVFHNIKSDKKEILWYDRELFKFFYKAEECPEMITLIKNSHLI